MPEVNLNRFVVAQESPYFGYDVALKEIRAGKKSSHWIWYIFPQMRGLGRSHYALFYGIVDVAEATAYLNHQVLGARLREISQALLEHRALSAEQILGGIDACKVRSCMTLFNRLAPNEVFGQVLEAFYDGECQATLAMLEGE
ncbi:MAG: DUF1810 domain-containing protein [Alistipes sp.]|nr:DUF1810 domain-containing protein [Alistipes sp.]